MTEPFHRRTDTWLFTVRVETVMGPTAGVHSGLGSAGPQAACCMSLAVPGEWGPRPPSFYRGYKAPKWQCQDLNQPLWCHLCLEYHVVLGGPPRTGGASSSHRAKRQGRPGQARPLRDNQQVGCRASRAGIRAEGAELRTESGPHRGTDAVLF